MDALKDVAFALLGFSIGLLSREAWEQGHRWIREL